MQRFTQLSSLCGEGVRLLRACALLLAVTGVTVPPAAASPSAPSAGDLWPDIGIPSGVVAEGQDDAALVVGIEDYLAAPKVKGAVRNATDWYSYLVEGRRVPIGHVRLLRNGDVTRETLLSRASEVSKLAAPSGTLWVIFIGHGAPSRDGSEGVLVGADAQQTAESLYARSVRQSELVAALAGTPAARTVMVLDACFSGRTSASEQLLPDLQPLIALPSGGASRPAPGRRIVMTAALSNQFAGPLPGAARPAFSYLVLGALRGWGDGNQDAMVTAREAVDYAAQALSVLPTGRTQTPELVGDGTEVLVHSARERGPVLSSIVAAPTSLETAGFGGGLENTPFAPLPEFQPPQGALADANVSLLSALQDAKRAEKNELLHASRKADAWDKLVAIPGKNPLKSAATDRRDAWRRVVRVCDQYAKDTAKLHTLLSMDEDVVSGQQKRAYEGEFRAAYAPWSEKLRSCGMADLPGATFAMGSSDAPEERPQHLVQLAPFSMDVTEVTVAAYAACVSARACPAAPLTVDASTPEELRREASKLCNGNRADRKEHPVNCVDWAMADAYCRWAGKRLPTEEEWEYAARGADGRKYPWGDEEPGNQVCWRRERLRQGTCGAGLFDGGRSPFGLLDMAGNVWEWTASGGSADYSQNRTTDTRVIRGGSWGVSAPSKITSSARVRVSPSLRNYYLGFRCARSSGGLLGP